MRYGNTPALLPNISTVALLEALHSMPPNGSIHLPVYYSKELERVNALQVRDALNQRQAHNQVPAETLTIERLFYLSGFPVPLGKKLASGCLSSVYGRNMLDAWYAGNLPQIKKQEDLPPLQGMFIFFIDVYTQEEDPTFSPDTVPHFLDVIDDIEGIATLTGVDFEVSYCGYSLVADLEGRYSWKGHIFPGESEEPPCGIFINNLPAKDALKVLPKPLQDLYAYLSK